LTPKAPYKFWPVEIISKFPEEVQEVSSFSAAIMRGTSNTAGAERLIASLTGDRAAVAYRASGVDPIIG
jgi:molybdate transport system substrate-binding protein